MEKISSNILELLNKYSDSERDGSYINDYISRVTDSKPIIPVLGMQGVGKSTLINALLEENILPNEADETTCVPVEIKYGENEHADIFFNNSKEISTVNTLTELRDYVDNNFNPGNEKCVLKIVLYRKRELLKSGITIVDLPGVGSLTSKNEETTNKYIENLCTAIFVISVVPTIRKNEALFIKSVWSQFSRAIFVENHWDESNSEIKESLDYNSKLLRGLAESLNNSFDNNILVVNAYNAIAGSLRKDNNLKNSSNISSLYDTINKFSLNWKELQTQSLQEKISSTVDSAIKYAKRLLDEFSKNKEENICNRERELNDLQFKTNKLEEEMSKVKSYLSQQEFNIRTSSKNKASECMKRLRAAMNKTIDSGVYDGDALTQAFNDEQKEKVTECLDTLFDEITVVKIEVDTRIQDLSDIELNDDMKYTSEEIHKEHGFRFEKGIDILFKLGGGVGGIYACAKAGALAGTYFSPGIGTAVGLVAGALVGIVGSVVGSYAKKEIGELRASNTKRELEPLYNKIESTIKKTVSEKFNEYSESVKKALDSVIQQRRDIERLKKEHLYDFEDEGQIDNINNDIKTLIDYKRGL